MWVMAGNAGNPFRNNDGPAQIGKQPAKSIGRADRYQRQRKNQAGKAEIVGKKPDMSWVESRDHNNEDVSDGDYAGFGRSKPPGEDAAQKDGWDHQGERCVLQSCRQIAKWRAATLHASRAKEIAIDH